MGSIQVAGMKEAVDRGMLKERQMLRWHLRYNHYPPLPVQLVPTCQAALDALREDDPDRTIDMPDGIRYRDRDHATAREIAESTHLWDMV